MSYQAETLNIHPVTSKYGKVDFHLWQDSKGWWSCRSGEHRGITSESDDLGPFPTWLAALNAQQKDFDAFNEDAGQGE